MEKVRTATGHEIPDRPPWRIAPGDAVETGDVDTTWPEFTYVIAEGGEGWVPTRYLSAAGDSVIVEQAYDTTELATTAGEELEILRRDDESGWLWCRNRAGGEGWVPSNTLEEVG